MKKQLLFLVLGTGLFVGGGHVFADETEEVVRPDSELYDTTRIMEEVEYDLTEDTSDKAILQDQYATKRLKESQVAMESGDLETSEQLLEESNLSAEQADADLTEAKSSGDDNAEEVEKSLSASLEERTKELTKLLEREDLPEEARQGISNAIKQVEHVVQRAKQREELQSKLAADEITEEEFGSEMKALAETFKEEAKKNREEARKNREKREDEVEKDEEEAREEAEEREEEAREEA
ncbi:hypothetical protein CEY16_09215, partial [Halalkalibacillus sediminis]